jgi:hypothetical protein
MGDFKIRLKGKLENKAIFKKLLKERIINGYNQQIIG